MRPFRLLQQIKDRGRINLKDLAPVAQMSVPWVQQVMSGVTTPTPGKALILARALGATKEEEQALVLCVLEEKLRKAGFSPAEIALLAPPMARIWGGSCGK